MKPLFLFLFVSAATRLLSQTIENVDFRAVGKTISVSYDFLHPKADTSINVALVFKDQQGVSIVPKSISGDLKNVKPGEGKRITWDVLADGISLSGKYKVIIEILAFKKAFIGSKVWMGENLNVARFKNGDLIPQARNLHEMREAFSRNQPVWCYWDFDSTNGSKYGKLYNWYAVNDKRGLAPAGWHIASDEDWTELISYVGAKNAGIHLKSEVGWFAYKNYTGNGKNTFDFSVLPGGSYCCIQSDDKGMRSCLNKKNALFWTSTIATDSSVWGRQFSFERNDVDRADYPFRDGQCFSVRCVLDVAIGNFGNKSPSALYVDSLLNENSKELYIGSKIWMNKNLNVDHFRNGDPIPQAKTEQEWKRAGEAKQPAWCYYGNDPKNGDKLGKLYNWYAVNDKRGLSPKGWHIPSAEEWEVLDFFLTEARCWAGKSTDWIPKFDALPSGSRDYLGYFDRIPPIDGDGVYGRELSAEESNSVYWWVSSASSTVDAKSRDLFGLDCQDCFFLLFSNIRNRGDGLSVRCIKD